MNTPRYKITCDRERGYYAARTDGRKESLGHEEQVREEIFVGDNHVEWFLEDFVVGVGGRLNSNHHNNF